MPIIRDLLADLPSVEAVLICPFLEQAPALDGLDHAVLFDVALTADPITDYSPMPFNHPLYIMYSSRGPPARRNASPMVLAAQQG